MSQTIKYLNVEEVGKIVGAGKIADVMTDDVMTDDVMTDDVMIVDVMTDDVKIAGVMMIMKEVDGEMIRSR
jgi:hypothetical protein